MSKAWSGVGVQPKSIRDRNLTTLDFTGIIPGLYMICGSHVGQGALIGVWFFGFGTGICRGFLGMVDYPL